MIVFVLKYGRVERLFAHVFDHRTVCGLILKNNLRTVHHVYSVQRTTSNYPRDPLTL